MRSGKLSELVLVQRSAATLNAAGTPSFAWSDVASLRAELVEDGVAEAIRSGGGASAEAVLVFRTRFLADVTTADRLLWRGRALNLKGVTVLGRTRGLELRAVAPEGGL